MEINADAASKVDARYICAVGKFNIIVYYLADEVVIPTFIVFLRNKGIQKTLFKYFLKENYIFPNSVRARFRQETSVISAENCLTFWRQNKEVLNEITGLEVESFIQELESIVNKSTKYIQTGAAFTVDVGIKLEVFFIPELGEYRITHNSAKNLLACCYQKFVDNFEYTSNACIAVNSLERKAPVQTFPLNSVLDFLESSCSETYREKPFLTLFIKYARTSLNDHLNSIILAL